jgi:WbqC-like protein family
MNCVILQPSYIPWRGYFHLIQKADLFIFYDTPQYDKRGWRNRNRIKSPTGTQWLTIPVLAKGSRTRHLPIQDMLCDPTKDWCRKHWATIKYVYGKAPYFPYYVSLLRRFYALQPRLLADFTIELTVALARELGLDKTQFVRSSTLKVSEATKTDALLELLQEVGATHYISGPSAKDYIEEDKFRAAEIGLEYMVYQYPEYEQLYPPFDPYVSILDLLFMVGPEAPKFIWDCLA